MMLNQDIQKLDLDSKLIKKLKDNNIDIVRDLWKQKRTDLKKIGLSDNEINQVIIKMQLQGIDLNQKIYKHQ